MKLHAKVWTCVLFDSCCWSQNWLKDVQEMFQRVNDNPLSGPVNLEFPVDSLLEPTEWSWVFYISTSPKTEQCLLNMIRVISNCGWSRVGPVQMLGHNDIMTWFPWNVLGIYIYIIITIIIILIIIIVINNNNNKIIITIIIIRIIILLLIIILLIIILLVIIINSYNVYNSTTYPTTNHQWTRNFGKCSNGFHGIQLISAAKEPLRLNEGGHNVTRGQDATHKCQPEFDKRQGCMFVKVQMALTCLN